MSFNRKATQACRRREAKCSSLNNPRHGVSVCVSVRLQQRGLMMSAEDQKAIAIHHRELAEAQVNMHDRHVSVATGQWGVWVCVTHVCGTASEPVRMAPPLRESGEQRPRKLCSAAKEGTSGGVGVCDTSNTQHLNPLGQLSGRDAKSADHATAVAGGMGRQARTWWCPGRSP